MAELELHSFMGKLLNLRRAGKNAQLTIECKHGKTYVNLQLYLEDPPGPVHRPRPSPSRLCRRARRENSRNTAAVSAPVHDKSVQTDPPADITVNAAVQVVIPVPLAVDAAVQAVIPAPLSVHAAVQARSPKT